MRKLNKIGFIERAQRIHGTRYDYSRSEYTNSRVKIAILCRDHGEFYQTPSNHLSGNGCPYCGDIDRRVNNRVIFDEFVSRSRKHHGLRYTYDSSSYSGGNGLVVIHCDEHGDFYQKASSHMNGSGCPACAVSRVSGSNRSTTREFIEKSRQVHGMRYSYELVDYVYSKGKVVIVCEKHGEFKQKPNSHLLGQGCPSCKSGGFSSNSRSYLYILLDAETHSRVKIGITNKPEKRFKRLKRDTPFAIERIDLFETPPEITLQIEKFCHSQLESCGMQGFSGATEWFKFDGAKIEALREFIKSCGGVVA